MAKVPLLVLVEGPSDETFFNRVILPNLRSKYSHVTVIPYARMQAKIVGGVVRAFVSSGAEYVMLHDRDSHVHTCRAECRNECLARCPGLDTKRVRIVEEAIESWLVAVANGAVRTSRGWAHAKTDMLSKANFHSMLGPNETPYDVQQEILRSPDLVAGRKRNTSLDYFFLRLP